MVLRELLTTFILTAHLLAMNVASAGPLLAIWLRWREANGCDRTSDIGRRLAWWSVRAFIIGMLMGGLIFLTVPTEGLSLAVRRFPPNAYWYAGLELAFSFACLTALAALWSRLNRWWCALLALASATNLLYHFPPMMAVIGLLAQNARWTTEPLIERPVLLRLMVDNEVLALSFHFVLSSCAVSAIFLLQLWHKCYSHEPITTGPQATPRRIATVALVATVLQVPVGIWLMTSVSTPVRSALMGGSMAALAFLAAITGAIVLIQRLFAMALGETDRRSVRIAVVLMCSVVFLMTMSLRFSRPNAPVAQNSIKTASCTVTRGCCNS